MYILRDVFYLIFTCLPKKNKKKSFLSFYHAALLAGQLSEASPDLPSRPQSSTTEAEKDKIKEATAGRSHTTISLHHLLMHCIRIE